MFWVWLGSREGRERRLILFRRVKRREFEYQSSSVDTVLAQAMATDNNDRASDGRISTTHCIIHVHIPRSKGVLKNHQHHSAQHPENRRVNLAQKSRGRPTRDPPQDCRSQARPSILAHRSACVDYFEPQVPALRHHIGWAAALASEAGDAALAH